MSAKRRRIAAILPLELEYSGRLLDGALEYARSHRQVTLVDVPYRVESPSALRLRSPFAFDAALIWATLEARWVEDLLAAGVPLVAASGDWPVARVPCISFDSAAVVHLAVDHLAALRPAVMVHLEYLTTGVPLNESRARLFREAAARWSIPTLTTGIFRPGDKHYSALASRLPLADLPARRLREVLRDLPRPAAIWCGEDSLGVAVCEAAEALGLRIPDDVAVLGLGNFRAAESGNPPLSSIPLPGEMIGYQAFAVLDRKLSGESGFPEFTPVLPPAIVGRQSTIAGLSHDPLSRALAIIAARACEGITVREVAAAVSLSSQALTTRFNQRFGRSPGEEIRRAKVATAKRHLDDPRLSIARIADLCGFNQQSKFSNFFRRETGATPRAWRQRIV